MSTFPIKAIALLWAGLNCLSSCSGQQTFGTNLLRVVRMIPLTGIKGRIDHLDINLATRVVYISALGNNSLEEVDLRTGKLIRSIGGLDGPQGVVYIPRFDEVMVANGGNGKCDFFNARTGQKLGMVQLSGDADNVRLGPGGIKVYVGYGHGGIAVIDAHTHLVNALVQLPAHPESFQLDEGGNRIFVNLPDAGMTAVLDKQHLKVVGTWRRALPAGNFPMAMDTAHHQLYIGYRFPSRLITLDDRTGKILAENALAPDADDLYFDYLSGSIFASCGAGFLDIYRLQTAGTMKQVGAIPTRKGARTALLVPALRLLLLAERAAGGKPAQLVVYKILD
ncbi:MAG TPA: hypothetical protein VNE41_08245 [Chitinophagaceae bacterium]|nr:hypothetical protein [Chitinophagaceae bacterium]